MSQKLPWRVYTQYELEGDYLCVVNADGGLVCRVSGGWHGVYPISDLDKAAADLIVSAANFQHSNQCRSCCEQVWKHPTTFCKVFTDKT